MDKTNKNKSQLTVEEQASPYVKTFSSQEEAERYNMIENIEKSDMDKFLSFCSMIRMQRLYSRAKIYNMKDIK